jgi:hypothetical protein
MAWTIMRMRWGETGAAGQRKFHDQPAKRLDGVSFVSYVRVRSASNLRR